MSETEQLHDSQVRSNKLLFLKQEIEIRSESHILMASDWGITAFTMLILNVILATLTGSTLFELLNASNLVSAFSAFLVALNSALLAAIEPSKRSEKHKESIFKYRQAAIEKNPDELEQLLGSIESEAPILRARARIRAKKRLERMGKLNLRRKLST